MKEGASNKELSHKLDILIGEVDELKGVFAASAKTQGIFGPAVLSISLGTALIIFSSQSGYTYLMFAGIGLYLLGAGLMIYLIKRTPKRD